MQNGEANSHVSEYYYGSNNSQASCCYKEVELSTWEVKNNNFLLQSSKMIYTVYFSDIIQKKHAYTPFAVSSHINKILKFLSSMLWKALSSMLLKNFPIMVTYRWLTTEMRLEFKIPRIPIFMATASWSVPGWRQYVQMGALVDDRSHAQSTSSWRGFNLNRKCLSIICGPG